MKQEKNIKDIGIYAVSHFLPDQVMTAEEIAEKSGLSRQTIVDSFGMLEKRVSSESEHPTDMAIKAAKLTLAKANISAKEIDFIIYAGNDLYDHQFWSPAAKIQEEIGAENAFVLDINNGCTSALTGLYLATKLLQSSTYHYGLLVSSDTISKFVDYKDTDTLPFFSAGDGASAALLKNNYTQNRFVSFALHSAGQYVDLNKIPVGGTKSLSTDHNKKANFIQVDRTHKNMEKLIGGDGELVKNYIEVVKQAIDAAHITLNQVSYFLFNQVSKRVMNRVLEELHIPNEKIYLTCEKFGHMTIDVLFSFEKCLHEKRFKKGDYVALANAGIGFHWNACVIQI